MSNYRRRLLLTNQSETNLYLYGNSVQDGIPTPDAPIDIMSIENPTIKILGKNLLAFPYEITSNTYKNIKTTVNSDGSILLNGTGSNTEVFNLNLHWNNPIILPAGNYTIGGIISKNCYFVLYNGTTKKYSYTQSQNIQITLTEETQIKLCIQFVPGAILDNVLIKPFINKQEQYTGTWVPYYEENITINENTPFGKNWVANDVYNIDNWIQVGNGYGYYLNLPAGDYTASVEKKDNSNQFFYLQISTNDWSDYVTKHILKGTENNRVTITIEENTKCRFYTTNSAFANSVDSIQIEKSKYYTGYEPYVPPITVMHGIGDYKDHIYTKEGKVYFEQMVGVFENDNLADKFGTASSPRFYYYFEKPKNSIPSGITQTLQAQNPGLCNYFKYNPQLSENNTIFILTQSVIRAAFFTEDIEDVEDWVADKIISVIYPIVKQEPIEITGHLAEKILAIDKTKNIYFISENGIQGETEVIEE